MVRSKAAVAVAALLSAAGTCHAGSIVCSGTVVQLAYHQPDTIFLRLSSMNEPVLICSVNVEWVVSGSLSGNTSVSACKTLYATLLAAKMAEKPITHLYLDGDQVPASCTSFASWTRVNVRYVE